MQKLRHILFFIVFSSSTTILAEDGLYILDETHLSIGFLVDHAGYARTLGMFTKARG